MLRTMVVFDDRTLSFRCAGCLGRPYEVRRGLMRDPEMFSAERERIEQDHGECPNFDSPRLAHNARMLKIRIRREMALQRPLPIPPPWAQANAGW